MSINRPPIFAAARRRKINLASKTDRNLNRLSSPDGQAKTGHGCQSLTSTFGFQINIFVLNISNRPPGSTKWTKVKYRTLVIGKPEPKWAGGRRNDAFATLSLSLSLSLSLLRQLACLSLTIYARKEGRKVAGANLSDPRGRDRRRKRTDKTRQQQTL
jgi:hypothetical protein